MARSPDDDDLPRAARSMVGASLLFAGMGLAVKVASGEPPNSGVVFYFAVLSTAISAVPVVVAWQTPTLALWPTLLAMGVLATAGQLLLTRAYAHAPAGRVGPFIYTAVVFAGALDWIFRGVVPDALSLCGATLVMAAGIMALRTKVPER